MFSGIIEELGIISKVEVIANSMQLTICAKKTLINTQIGHSIAVNGVCLTVTSLTNTAFTVDVMPETFHATSLSLLKKDSKVNLERALAIGERLGGHFVTGHVDGMGIIKNIKPEANAIYYTIALVPDLLDYCIHRGSIAVDGTSLTIFGLDAQAIILSLIPHTVKHSVLGEKQLGDKVNIECDMLGKYIAHLLSKNLLSKSLLSKSFAAKANLDKNFLVKHGFM